VEFEITPATFGTLGLAAIAGLRSMAAPALLARAVRRGDLDAPNLPSLAKKEVSGLLSILAAGEMAADKTPFIPARTSAPALLGRLLSGALVGATLFASEGRHGSSGAVLGALSALGAAYAGEGLRAAGTRKGIPDPILGTLEDRAVLTIGTRLLRKG
jgi:uncharacterized membrane protein